MTVPEIERKPITLTDSQESDLIDAYISLRGLHNLLLSAEAHELDPADGKSYLDSDVLHMVAVFANHLSNDLAAIIM